MTRILELDDVHTYYGNIHALKGISLTVERGEIVTLIGSNGAGKSTTLRTISAVQRAREGRVLFEDREIQGMPPHEVVKLGIAQSPEGRHVFARMTVYENLQMGAYSRPNRADLSGDLDRVYNLFPRLKERTSQVAGTLSGGEQQMLAMGRALMARPKMICMDEPSMGLSPLLVQTVFDTIQEIRKQGVTVFVVEQNAFMALNIADRGYVLQQGRVVLADAAKNLLENDLVRSAYLGG